MREEVESKGFIMKKDISLKGIIRSFILYKPFKL